MGREEEPGQEQKQREGKGQEQGGTVWFGPVPGTDAGSADERSRQHLSTLFCGLSLHPLGTLTAEQFGSNLLGLSEVACALKVAFSTC